MSRFQIGCPRINLEWLHYFFVSHRDKIAFVLSLFAPSIGKFNHSFKLHPDGLLSANCLARHVFPWPGTTEWICGYANSSQKNGWVQDASDPMNPFHSPSPPKSKGCSMDRFTTFRKSSSPSNKFWSIWSIMPVDLGVDFANNCLPNLRFFHSPLLFIRAAGKQTTIPTAQRNIHCYP